MQGEPHGSLRKMQRVEDPGHGSTHLESQFLGILEQQGHCSFGVPDQPGENRKPHLRIKNVRKEERRTQAGQVLWTR